MDGFIIPFPISHSGVERTINLFLNESRPFS